jgi:N-acetyl-gamma-glutamyl-phosphate reductase common form
MTSNSDNIRVGVLGASGYIGAEVMRYIALHPNLTLEWATANRDAGKLIGDVFPNLRGCFPHSFLTSEGGEARIGEIDVVFLALPHSESQNVLPRLAGEFPDTIWIDLAGDFRTPDPEGFEKYYGGSHRAPNLLDRFVYGFTEGQRDALAGAKLIANPGCFATGMLLVLYPLLNTGTLSDPICVTALTGSSGSGREPNRTTHHPERAQNLKAYKMLKHQHLLEVEWFLNGRSDNEIRLQFVPQSAPIVRGIFTTLFLPGQSADEVLEIFGNAYGDEALIDVITGSPDIRVVASTPRSIIGIAGEDDRGAVVFSVIDNLGKGAAGQAIQNMNRAVGLAETTGLAWPGGYV